MFPHWSCLLWFHPCSICNISFLVLWCHLVITVCLLMLKKKSAVILLSASRLSSPCVILTGSVIIKWIDLSWKQHPVTLSGLALSAGGLNGSGLLTDPTGSLLVTGWFAVCVYCKCAATHLSQPAGQLECDTCIESLVLLCIGSVRSSLCLSFPPFWFFLDCLW